MTGDQLAAAADGAVWASPSCSTAAVRLLRRWLNSTSASSLAARRLIPGPSPVPDRVLHAMDMPVIDHRSEEFAELGRDVLEDSQAIFQTTGPVIIFPSSGTGAWEAAIVNTLSPSDRVLMVETGHFATLWHNMAGRWGIDVEFMPGDRRRGADPAAIEQRLAQDSLHAIKAVMVVHNETSTGATSRIGEIRAAMDRAGHPALLMVDTISSLGSVDYRHDEWKVDVSVSCSQKGFMLPPGLGFNAISEKARAASRTNRMPRSYWDWEEMLKPNAKGFFPTRRRPICSTACARRSRCCSRRACEADRVCCRDARKTNLITAGIAGSYQRRRGGTGPKSRCQMVPLSNWMSMPSGE